MRVGSRVISVRSGRRGESGIVLLLRGDKAKVRGDNGRPFFLQTQAAFRLALAAALRVPYSAALGKKKLSVSRRMSRWTARREDKDNGRQ